MERGVCQCTSDVCFCISRKFFSTGGCPDVHLLLCTCLFSACGVLVSPWCWTHELQVGIHGAVFLVHDKTSSTLWTCIVWKAPCWWICEPEQMMASSFVSNQQYLDYTMCCKKVLCTYSFVASEFGACMSQADFPALKKFPCIMYFTIKYSASFYFRLMNSFWLFYAPCPVFAIKVEHSFAFNCINLAR